MIILYDHFNEVINLVEFIVFEEGMQVSGAAIMSVIDGMRSFDSIARAFLNQSGLPDDLIPDTEHWYSQQKWLDAFKLISEKVGFKTLFVIGTKIPENAVFPKDIDNVEKALASIDIAYHMNHKNAQGEILFDPSRPLGQEMKEGIGHYGFEKIAEENKAVIICNNPYPCDFDSGIISAMAKRFSYSSKVTHDDTQPCRKKGANSCTYIATWK